MCGVVRQERRISCKLWPWKLSLSCHAARVIRLCCPDSWSDRWALRSDHLQGGAGQGRVGLALSHRCKLNCWWSLPLEAPATTTLPVHCFNGAVQEVAAPWELALSNPRNSSRHEASSYLVTRRASRRAEWPALPTGGWGSTTRQARSLLFLPPTTRQVFY